MARWLQLRQPSMMLYGEWFLMRIYSTLRILHSAAVRAFRASQASLTALREEHANLQDADCPLSRKTC
jgi:hypothetical protein